MQLDRAKNHHSKPMAWLLFLKKTRMYFLHCKSHLCTGKTGNQQVGMLTDALQD